MCDFVLKMFYWCVYKFFIFPVALFTAPVMFVLVGNKGCERAKKEVAEFLYWAWSGELR